MPMHITDIEKTNGIFSGLIATLKYNDYLQMTAILCLGALELFVLLAIIQAYRLKKGRHSELFIPAGLMLSLFAVFLSLIAFFINKPVSDMTARYESEPFTPIKVEYKDARKSNDQGVTVTLADGKKYHLREDIPVNFQTSLDYLLKKRDDKSVMVTPNKTYKITTGKLALKDNAEKNPLAKTEGIGAYKIKIVEVK